MIKLVAIDLDGTLLHSDCTISEYTKSVITKACEQGIIVVPTSGRSFRNIKEQIKDLDCLRYCISSNGCLITDLKTEEIIYHHKIPAAKVYDIYCRTRDMGGFIQLYSGTETYVEKELKPLLYETGLSEDFCESLMSTDVPILSARLLLKRGLMDVNKIHVAFKETEKSKAFAEYCKNDSALMLTYPSYYNMEIFSGNCNKDVGIQVLAERFGIKQEEICAIGDSDNDVSMIRYAHIGLAVENAMPVLKEAADQVIKSNDEDGPAQALESILEGNEKKF